MIRFFLLFSLMLVSGYADIKLEDIESKPPCRAKDFMIWQFLKQDITPQEADKAFSQVNNKKNPKILSVYAKKTHNKEVKYRLSCRKKQNLLAIEDKECLELAFTPYKATKLTDEQRVTLISRLDSESKKSILRILNEKNIESSYRNYDVDTVMSLLNNTGKKYRKEYLNINFDKDLLDYISESWRFTYFIKKVVHDDSLENIQSALLKIDGEKLNSMSNFLLALNHLRHYDKHGAIKHFKLSRSKARFKINADKNNFWLYLVTQKDEYLQKLYSSLDINIYTIYAREKLNKEFDNYFTSLKTNNDQSSKNLMDPFDWHKILSEIKNTNKNKLFALAQMYKYEDMLPVRSWIIQKAYNHNMHGYMMPYDEYLNGLNTDEKALIYAIMRQESNMIPSALSHSYALGLMQIMPFLTDAISKEIKDPVTCYDDMFIPKNNIRYSRAHLKWMKKSLYHPLFIAYAYNGGLGFLKRFLKGDKFKKGMYEPFLSMEMMMNSESREYGKKVLANYVMYKKILGEDISIEYLFDTLTQPKMTDCFREKG